MKTKIGRNSYYMQILFRILTRIKLAHEYNHTRYKANDTVEQRAIFNKH